MQLVVVSIRGHRPLAYFAHLFKTGFLTVACQPRYWVRAYLMSLREYSH